ncbi:hypothetical protein QCA50_017943 [Cerrena zonata]|uniref:PARP catalytic domain-containing protein n=1 Tax=Cerrena zonata TaxID=2478898 RepID=A0AAW0FLC4_9APHY
MALPPKGRKRFLADLESAIITHKSRGSCYKTNELQITDLFEGEDEGAFVCAVSDSQGNKYAYLSFIISDTSDYPKYHTFYCFSLDGVPSPPVQRVIDRMADCQSITIDGLLESMLEFLAKDFTSGHPISEIQKEDDEAETDGEDVQGDFDVSMSSGLNIDSEVMQRDFQEIIAAGYRPNIIRLRDDEVVISVSIPVISLASTIEPRALMAWDSRLLSKSQYLTLIISGMQGIYPFTADDGTFLPNLAGRGVKNLQYHVGLTPQNKPDQNLILSLLRSFNVPTIDEIVLPSIKNIHIAESILGRNPSHEFNFSLSASLESLLRDRFMQIIRLRLKCNIGWAGAESLISSSSQMQISADELFFDDSTELLRAEEEEQSLASSYSLPSDPLANGERPSHINVPLLAFSYLIRRLTLCTRFCLVCYNKIDYDFETLKPYVCNSKLCTYQYYNLNFGTPLEYEICFRPATVDLLVSFAYIAAAEKSLRDPLPTGMGLMVPDITDMKKPAVDFDQLSKDVMQRTIVYLLNTLPPIQEMKEYLESIHKGTIKPRLADMDPQILPAAWLLLRWCIASCTAHIDEIMVPEDCVGNIDPPCRQFRFSIGAPDKEAKFRTCQENAKARDANAAQYPSLYAFHGSPVKNWHSIIRHGLLLMNVVHGRSYGDGVYFAKQGQVSMGTYASPSSFMWRSTRLNPISCAALAELDTDWIICRYLLVRCGDISPYLPFTETPVCSPVPEDTPSVELDPAHPLTFSGKNITIPEPGYRLQQLLEARRKEFENEGDTVEIEDIIHILL